MSCERTRISNDSSSFAATFSSTSFNPKTSFNSEANQRFAARPRENFSITQSIAFIGNDKPDSSISSKKIIQKSSSKTELWAPVSENNEKKPKRPISGTGNSLKTNDIPGAISKGTKAMKKEAGWALKTEDIPGAMPKSTRSLIKVPSGNLNTKDIPGAIPRSNKPISNRIVNPLEPQYKLPTPIKFEPPKQRFLRDSIDVHVINMPLT